MTPALIWDCSVAIAMAFEDERDEYVRRVFGAVRHEGALVPAHWHMEVVNVLRVAERRKRPACKLRIFCFIYYHF